MKNVYFPYYWGAFPFRSRLRLKAKQSIAMLIGLWRGRGLETKVRCRHCGGIARFAGGKPDRGYCENKLCTNYVPF